MKGEGVKGQWCKSSISDQEYIWKVIMDVKGFFLGGGGALHSIIAEGHKQTNQDCVINISWYSPMSTNACVEVGVKYHRWWY